mgnify:CR=1 FL=1
MTDHKIIDAVKSKSSPELMASHAQKSIVSLNCTIEQLDKGAIINLVLNDMIHQLIIPEGSMAGDIIWVATLPRIRFELAESPHPLYEKYPGNPFDLKLIEPVIFTLEHLKETGYSVETYAGTQIVDLGKIFNSNISLKCNGKTDFHLVNRVRLDNCGLRRTHSKKPYGDFYFDIKVSTKLLPTLIRRHVNVFSDVQTFYRIFIEAWCHGFYGVIYYFVKFNTKSLFANYDEEDFINVFKNFLQRFRKMPFHIRIQQMVIMNFLLEDNYVENPVSLTRAIFMCYLNDK